MRNSRRIKRMGRNRVKIAKMNLTSLMDVFTILVFFLLVNSGSVEVMEAPKTVELPESVVETKPRETVVIFVSPEDVLVQGVNMVKRHAKQSMTDPGGIQQKEAPIHLSNVAHFDQESQKATRIGYRILEDGRKVRYAKRSGEQID